MAVKKELSADGAMLAEFFKKNCVHPSPFEVAQQLIQLVLHAVNVDVMPKARLAAYACNAGLLGVNFPGMNIKDARLAVLFVHATQHPA